MRACHALRVYDFSVSRINIFNSHGRRFTARQIIARVSNVGQLELRDFNSLSVLLITRRLYKRPDRAASRPLNCAREQSQRGPRDLKALVPSQL